MTNWFHSLKGAQRTGFIMLCALAALILPLIVQQAGSGWVRILDVALLYILLSLGLNIVVGNAACWTWALWRSMRWVRIPTLCWPRRI